MGQTTKNYFNIPTYIEFKYGGSMLLCTAHHSSWRRFIMPLASVTLVPFHISTTDTGFIEPELCTET